MNTTINQPIATKPGQSSPWGTIEHSKRLAEGIWFVSTRSHGGIWLSEERCDQLNERLPIFAMKCSHYPTFCGSCQHWEEDCDWVVPTLAFADDLNDPVAADAAANQLAAMAKSYGGKYQRAANAFLS